MTYELSSIITYCCFALFHCLFQYSLIFNLMADKSTTAITNCYTCLRFLNVFYIKCTHRTQHLII